MSGGVRGGRVLSCGVVDEVEKEDWWGVSFRVRRRGAVTMGEGDWGGRLLILLSS